jgi:hypothetical protein
VAGCASFVFAQDAPSVLKHPRGDLWVVLPPGWTGTVDPEASRIDLASRSRASSVTVAAFPSGRTEAQILDAVKERFARIATEGGAGGIAWETSELAVPPVTGFRVEGRGAAFVRLGHPIRLEVYLLRGADAVFAFAAVGDALTFDRERPALSALLAQARPSATEAAAVASAQVATLTSTVELPTRAFRLRVPARFTVEPDGDRLLIHAAEGNATLLAAYRETALDPTRFLDSLRAEYVQNLESQLGREGASLTWGQVLTFTAGPRTGVSRRLVVAIERAGARAVRIEQRFYALPAPAGVLFLTGSAEEDSGDARVFDAIAESVRGTGDGR